MSEGRYSVIRCIPDAARGETVNVGILLWNGGDWNLAVDQLAARRAARQGPQLAHGALDGLEESLRTQIHSLAPLSATKFSRFIRTQPELYFSFSAPQFVRIQPGAIDRLEPVLDRLMSRLVREPRMPSPHVPPQPEPQAAMKLRLWKHIEANKVKPKYAMIGKRTNQPRSVDFFVTGGDRAALDILSLAAEEDHASEQADAESFKVFDLMDERQPSEFHVLCIPPNRHNAGELVARATASLQSVGAKVLTDFDEAVAVIDSKVAA